MFSSSSSAYSSRNNRNFENLLVHRVLMMRNNAQSKKTGKNSIKTEAERSMNEREREQRGIFDPPDSKSLAFAQARNSIERVCSSSSSSHKNSDKRTKRRKERVLAKKKRLTICVELPTRDDGAESMEELAYELVYDHERTTIVFADVNAKKKGEEKRNDSAIEMFTIEEALANDFIGIDERDGPVYLVGFSADDAANAMKLSRSKFNSARAIVLLNCEWEHAGDGGDIFKSEKISTGSFDTISDVEMFMNSFSVVYSYLPLQIENKVFGKNTSGAVFKSVVGGAPSGTPWRILMKDENGKYKQVGSMQRRPEGEDIQNTFYNAYAATSNVNKGVGAMKGTFDKLKESFLPNPFKKA
jgi:hypothetical protein